MAIRPYLSQTLLLMILFVVAGRLTADDSSATPITTDATTTDAVTTAPITTAPLTEGEARRIVEQDAADLMAGDEGYDLEDEPEPFGWSWWMFFYFGWGRYLYLGFLAWMLLSCLRNDPDRGGWFWVILVFQPLGPVLYFVIRWIPQLTVTPPAFLRRWTSGKEIRQLEIAAQRIGNAHQFIELGDALNEVGRTEPARAAFAHALAKDPDNVPGLWGGAVADHAAGAIEAARDKLLRVMELDRTYKFGDASLLYAKCLVALKESTPAREQLEQHTRKWRHPEALFLLGEVYRDAGEFALAREQWEGIIVDLESAPAAIARKSMHWKGKARKKIRSLPSS